MTTSIEAAQADRELKDRHRAMWASGDYRRVAVEVVAELGDVLVTASGVQPGTRVLDVAAGTGNAAIRAARAGADVVAADLTPELLETGRTLAQRDGVDLDWREADAETLPFDDDAFDVVMSCVGVMFAPHHQAAADELVRVCRQGGTIGLISWTPEGFIGQMFQTMKPYAAPPPPGASPPPLWGDEAHVRELLGDRVDIDTCERRTLVVDRFVDPVEFRTFFKAWYGPTLTAYRRLAGDPERTAELDQGLVDLARRFERRGGDRFTTGWEYLLLTATKR